MTIDVAAVFFHHTVVSVDAILNAKLSLVLKQGIDLNFKATVPKSLTVSDLDLSASAAAKASRYVRSTFVT